MARKRREWLSEEEWQRRMELHRRLHGPCFKWPDCPCQATLNEWQRELRECEATGQWGSREKWELAALCSVLALSCIAAHAQDREAREAAAAELEEPVFARLRDPDNPAWEPAGAAPLRVVDGGKA